MKKLFIIILSLTALQSFGQNNFNGVNAFRDTVKHFKEAQYQANYGSTFNIRSLVDKGYVDSARNKARDSVVALISGGATPTLQQVTTAGKTTVLDGTFESVRSWPVATGAQYTSNWAASLGYSGNGTNAGGSLTLREFGDGTGHIATINTVDLAMDHTVSVPETGHATDTFAMKSDLIGLGGGSGLADPGSNGIVVRTATNTTVARTMADGVGINWTNPSGVSSAPQANLKGWEAWDKGTVQTTNTTVTSLVTLGLPNDGSGTFVVEMVATKSDNTKSLEGRKTAHWHTTASVITIDEIVDDNADYLRGFTTADWTIDGTSGTIRIRVTGESSTTIDWSATYKLKYISYAL